MCIGGAVPSGSSISTCAKRPPVSTPLALMAIRPVFHQRSAMPVPAAILKATGMSVVVMAATVRAAARRVS
jgi:hypothetical protein